MQAVHGVSDFSAVLYFQRVVDLENDLTEAQATFHACGPAEGAG